MLSKTWIIIIVISCVLVIGLALGLGLGFGLRSSSSVNPSTTIPPTTASRVPIALPITVYADYLYVPVTNGGSNAELLIVNKDPLVASRTIPLLTTGATNSFFATLTPDQKTVYVSNTQSTRDITIVDVTDPMTVNGPSGTINLVNFLSNVVPTGSVVTPDGKWLYVCSKTSLGAVLQIRTADNTVTRVIQNPNFQNPVFIIVNSLGDTLYVANEFSYFGITPVDISFPANPVVHTNINIVTDNLGSDKLMNNICMSSDNRYLFVIPSLPAADAFVYIYDMITETSRKSPIAIADGKNVRYVNISPDDTTLYAINGDGTDANLFVIDLLNNFATTKTTMFASLSTLSGGVQVNSNLVFTTSNDVGGNPHFGYYDLNGLTAAPEIIGGANFIFGISTNIRLFSVFFV